MQSTFRAGGRDIPIDMHEPTTASPHPAIVLMHASGGNVGFWVDPLAPHLSAAGIALYAPRYFERTNTTRADLSIITDGVHVPQWLDTLDAALTFASTRPNVDPARVAVIGISLGAFLTLGLAAQLSASPDPAVRRRIRALVDICGGLAEPFASLATSDFPRTLIIHGEADNVVPVSQARALDQLLTTLEVPHETHILPGEGHWFGHTVQMKLLMIVGNFLRQNL
jgi:carboxymethylenebutenolidase